jgi:23S rRNA (guanosine2251-2'-O)-methyltransferase
VRFVYGRHPVEALLEARPKTVVRLIVVRESERLPAVERARQVGVRVEVVPRDRLASLARTEHHQNLLAEASDYEYAPLESVVPATGAALVLALDSVQDPQNFGALVRSAECFDASGVVVPQDRAAAVTPAAGKASAGAVERIAIAQVVNLARALEALKERGAWITGLAGDGDDVIADVDMTGATVIVVGAEGSGLRPVIRKACDRIARIPIGGKTESLNASVAGGVALYEAARQRRGSRRRIRAREADMARGQLRIGPED